MPRLSHLSFSIIFSALPTFAFAWNAQGHQEVGAVTEQLIAGSHAERWVNYLLGDMNLRTVSVWADCAKGVRSTDDKTFVYLDNPQYVECAPFGGPEGAKHFESYVSRNWKQCGTVHGYETCHTQYHYTDVSNLRDHYDPKYVGTNNHDVVHSINAMIAVLRGQKPDAPYNIADKQEALMLLAHYVGDIHQPLHVSALYLDAGGKVIDPDSKGYKLGYDTAGGNNIFDNKKTFHSEWDSPPSLPPVGSDQPKQLLEMAKHVPAMTGDMNNWSSTWATDSIQVSHQIFSGLQFVMRPVAGGDAENTPEKWDATGIDAEYQKRADDIKMQQIAKAGAHLAQVLEAIWPDDGALPPTAVTAK